MKKVNIFYNKMSEVTVTKNNTWSNEIKNWNKDSFLNVIINIKEYLLHIGNKKTNKEMLELLKTRFPNLSENDLSLLSHPEAENIYNNVKNLHLYEFKDGLYKFCSCKFNRFENGYPIDPITLDFIDNYKNIAILENTGYDKDNILNMSRNNYLYLNPMTNEDLTVRQYEDLLDQTEYQGDYSSLMNNEDEDEDNNFTGRKINFDEFMG